MTDVWIFSNWAAEVNSYGSPFCRHLNDGFLVKISYNSFIISKIKINLSLFKVQIFRLQKLKKIPLFFDILGDFFKILLPSQAIWILMIVLFIKNGLLIAQKKKFNQKCMQKIPKPDSHYCLLVCQVRYRTPSHELSNKKRRKRILCFFTTTFTDVNFAKWQMICLNSSFIV